MDTAESILKEKNRSIISIDIHCTVQEALVIMVREKIRAIVVTDNENHVGIWTSYDLMRDIVEKKCTPETDTIGSFMSTTFKNAPHTDTAYALMDKFIGLKVRHLFIQKDDKCIGILSMSDVLRACLNQKNHELKELNAMVSWQYYETWQK